VQNPSAFFTGRGSLMRYYISIEKNNEGFEFFKALWAARGITGIRADTMTEGIERAIEIEKSEANELYFIDIVADDIDYMPQLRILHDETNTPILIATSKYDDDEHHEALNNGADFYGKYCDTPEQNITAVMAVVNSFDRRARKQRPPSQILTHGCLLISLKARHVFVSDTEVDLTKMEFDILHYLCRNRGTALTFGQIFLHVWGEEYEAESAKIVHTHIKRIRKKLTDASPNCDYIETVWNVGYRFSTQPNRE